MAFEDEHGGCADGPARTTQHGADVRRGSHHPGSSPGPPFVSARCCRSTTSWDVCAIRSDPEADAILRRQRHHPHADQPLPSLDKRAGRTDEPHDQELAPAQAGDATLKVFHYPDIESLKAHVLAFVKTCDFAKHLKALRWKRRSMPSDRRGQGTRRSSIRVTSFRDQTACNPPLSPENSTYTGPEPHG